MTTARRLVLILVGAPLLVVFIGRFVLVELMVRRVGIELVAAIIAAIATLGVGTLADRAFMALLPAGGEEKSSPRASTASRGVPGGRMRGNTGSSVAATFIIGYPIFGTLCFLIGTIRISAAAMIVPLVLGLGAAVIAIRVRLAPHPALRLASLAQGHSLASGEGSHGVDAGENHDLQGHLPPGEGARSAGGAREASALFAFFAIAAVLACAFVTAQAPPVSLDELAYHLAVPHTWTLEGRAVELPLLSHSYFPLGIEAADLPLFAFLGSTAGTASHFLHLIAAIAVSVLLWERARRWRRFGPLVATAIITTPALAVTTGWSLVDWPLVGIFIVAAAALEDSDQAMLGAAIAAGLLTKYTFVPFAIVLVALSRRWRPALLGCAAGSIFFVRNLVLTGNPVAPFLSAHAPHVSGFRTADLAAYIFDGRFVDESLGASLLMLIPAAAGTLAWIAIALAVLLFALAASSRILLPFLTVGVLSAARRSDDAEGRGASLSRRCFHALLIVAIAAQLLLVVWFTARDGAFSLIGASVSDDEYVAARRASYPGIAWLNSVLPSQSRTLVIGLNETYWFEHPVRGGGNFDGPRLSAYLGDGDLGAKLRRDGITHVAVFAQAVPTAEVRKREERESALSPQAQRALAALLSTERPAGGTAGVRLFQLR